MISLFKDTGLGQICALVSRKEAPEKKSVSLPRAMMQNYDLCLKLESQRIVADFLGEQRGFRLSSDSLSTQSDDSITRLKRGTSGEECTWDGPEDSENPLNFSSAQKFLITTLVCIITISTYLGSSIFSPGVPSLIDSFHTNSSIATLGTALSVFGYASGPMLWSPLSEVPSIGRNPVYILTFALFVMAQVPIACAKNMVTVLLFRFLSGFIGSSSLAIGGATIADIYEPKVRSYNIAIWELAAWIAPTLGPLVGGVAVQMGGWRWTIWVLMCINSVVLAVVICLLPETSASNILHRRAKRRGQRVPGSRPQESQIELTLAPQQSRMALVYHVLIRPFVLCFREPICLLLNAYTAFLTGIFFAWFEIFPVVFVDIYDFDLIQLGLAFMGVLIGAVVAYIVFVIWFRFSEGKKFDVDGKRRPEERFVPLMAGCIFIPLSLFSFGWGAREDVSWMVPIAGSGMFSLGSFSLFISILNYLPDAYPDYAASVLAGNNFIKCTFGAGCVVFAGPMYEKMGPAWASTMLGSIGLAFVPVPFLFYFYGDRIRMSSKYARKDF